MASIPSCVNSGGEQSLIQLCAPPVLEQECALDDRALSALSCWQLRQGDICTVVDPERVAYRARISALAEGTATCVPFARVPFIPESPIRIEIYQSLPEKERFELVLQKLTELGVDLIAPVESRHSTTRDERDAGQKKSHRWPDVIRKAANQCRRAIIPELMTTMTFDDVLTSAVDAELKLMLYEAESQWTLREAIGTLKPESVALMVGPEGGFADEEMQQARDAGFLPTGLGPRILRTETAAIVAATLVQGYLGDLG